jgi:hypothetical protein
MDRSEIKWDSTEWIKVAQRWALVKKAINFCVPRNVGIVLCTEATRGSSRSTQLHGIS